MPFYTYETIPARATVRRYELWQPMRNPPFSRHPETGESLQRIFPATRAEIAAGKRLKGARNRVVTL